MKKLLVLLLVLGLTSAANATILSIVVDGDEVGDEIWIEACTNIWLGMYQSDTAGTGNTCQFKAFMIIENAPALGSWTTTIVPVGLGEPAGSSSGNNYYSPPGVPPVATTGNVYYGTAAVPTKDIWYTDASNGVPTDYTGIGVVADFEFHCEVAPGDVLVQLYDSDMITVLDSLTIHQIPEPATMLLLGLGGLFLRRRK